MGGREIIFPGYVIPDPDLHRNKLRAGIYEKKNFRVNINFKKYYPLMIVFKNN